MSRKTTDAARVRVVVLRDNWLLSVDDWSPTFNYEKGISLLSVEAERSYPQIKSCSALSPYLASEEAKDAGFDEALLIDGDGIVREGAWSNFFWIDSQGHLKTAGEKILPGVTRSMVLELVREKFEIVIGDFTLEQMLSEAKEAFITQSTHGIVPVLRINDSSFLELESSKNIAKLYHELMRNNQIAV